MKLWVLRPRGDLPKTESANPWMPWFDKAFGFVVRAETEEEARALVDAGDEAIAIKIGDQSLNPWHDARYSTCEELTADGEAGQIMRDFASA